MAKTATVVPRETTAHSRHRKTLQGRSPKLREKDEEAARPGQTAARFFGLGVHLLQGSQKDSHLLIIMLEVLQEKGMLVTFPQVSPKTTNSLLVSAPANLLVQKQGPLSCKITGNF